MLFDYSDAWFLTTLILLKTWASIDDIIVTGDVINHAIFTSEEIEQAAQKLQQTGYIELDNNKLRTTQKANE